MSKKFDIWWKKFKAEARINKFVRKWLKDNPPNPEDEECGGDYWHVNQMIHDGEAFGMCYNISREVFERVLEGEEAEPSQSDSLYCELDKIIWAAYYAALEIKAGEKK